MEADENSAQVRRTARARKVNPKFFGDETGYDSYMRLVKRINAPNYTGISKDDDNLSKDSGSDDKQLINSENDNINHDGELNSQSSTVPQPVASNCNDNGSINIALKTVSLKKSKKSGNDRNSLKQGPSVIVRCRSSTESELSEDSVNEGEKKRKIVSSEENETKKLKVISEESNSEGSNSIENENSHSSLNSNIKIASLNSPQLLQKAYVSLPISNNLEKFQPKIVLGSQSKFNLPGKKLKIVSLKPITIKKDSIPISFDSKSPTSPENYSRKLVLEGGQVELKIVKKEVYPVCSSSLPPIIGSKGAKDKSLKSGEEGKSNDENVDAAGSWFSSDGEDDIPLNKLLVKEGVEKKKKKKLKDKSEKIKVKKIKSNETNKKTNDQDDLPLKVLIKKSKSLSKGLSDKFMNTIRKKKAKKAMKNEINSQNKAIKADSGKKKRKINANESSLDKDHPPLKIKSDIDQQDQKIKNLVRKRKKQKLGLVDGQESKNLVKKMHEKKLKRLNKLKATKSDLNLGSFKNENEFGNKKKIKDGKTFQKLRFKFPKKISKSISDDKPLSNETTNVVISVSGIEGDYACVAIPKPEDPVSQNPKIKSKLKKKRSSESSLPNKYTFDSGLVLEDVPIETNDINFESKVETSNLNTLKGKFNTLVKSEVGINNSEATDKYVLSEEDQKCQKERFPPQKEKNSYNVHPQLQKSNSKTFLNDVSKDSKDILLNEGNSKITNLEKKDTDKSKEKERKKEEKVKLNAIDKDIDVDKIKKLDSEHKHKLSRKDSSSSMSYNTEGIKTEDRSIKKEKSENSKKVSKESTDNKTEKLEKENKESSSKKMEKNIHSLNRLEREDSKHNLVSSSKKSSKEDKLDSNNSPRKLNKEATNKIVDKEIVKIEKETPKDDSQEAVSPIIKVKKKENFEEALLNIPLPKLSKHKKDRDKKDKDDKYKNYVKEKKYDVKQDLYLIKHRENDNEIENSKGKESSKSPVKIDKSNIKLESHSKDIKKEDRGHHREERRHSSSSSGRSKSEKRRSEYDSKESIKFHGDSSYEEGDKKRKDDKRRSSHSSSHKKHKKDHDSHRGHSSSSSSSDKRKHRSEESSKLDYKSFKEKLVVKSEDRKDLIINKIIDGAETNDIKREQEYPNFNLVDTKSETQISESELMLNSICPKNEMKAEVIIDEEHLVSVGKGSLKEEDNDDETITVSSEELKPKTASQSFPKEEVSALSSGDESKITLKKELPMETTKNNIENKENEDFGAVEGGEEIKKSINNTFVIEQKEDNPLLISGTDVKIYHTAKVNVESDLGILDELRTLKQMSVEERMKSEIQFNKDEIEERINTSVNQVNEQNFDLDKAEVDKKSDLEEIFGENENSPVDIALNLEQETDEVETKNDAKSVDKSLESADDSDVPPSDIFTADDLQKEEVDVLMSDLGSSSEHLVENNLVDDNNKYEEIIREVQHNYISNSPVDMLKTDAESDKSVILPSDIESEKPNKLQTPLSLIPLPSEDLETDDTIMNLQSPPSPLSPESTPMSPSEPDKGFSEASSHTRELISSEEEKISPEVSDDEDQPTEDVQLPVVKELTPEEKEKLERRNKQIVEERMNAFEHLSENLYLAEKVRNKRSKEARRMVCDCMLTKEEINNGEMGCADDCLNKLLMIECGSRCPLKDRCMNKKFQQKDYRDVEVFNAEEKGCGVRSSQEIKQGTFIMEYIGEVFDTREFKRRRKDYAKGGSPHFYFMALSNDRLIDATRKGNISRFVNHSCSPNAETQKWTVNGDVRVGFFATKNIPVGDEITFDYRLERYGREPQRCYCGTSECRGWLGEPPDKKTKEEKEEDRRRELKDKQKREAKRFLFEDMDLEDEIGKLTVRGLRNRQDTLDMSRLMVRCEDSESRLLLLKILESGEEASKRLFLDYHGLKLLWSWMVDISSSHKCIPLKLEILKTLNTLPITNKTQITDSKVLNIVERWSKLESKTEKNDAKLESDNKEIAVQDKKLSDGSDSDTETSETKDSDPSPSDTISPDDSSQDSNEIVDTVAPIDKEELKLSTPAVATNEVSATEEEDAKITDTDVASLASNLLSTWSELKEAFKIPKKERIEMMKEHEREVDKEYEKYMDRKEDDSFDDRKRGYYESWRYNSGDRDSQRDQRDRRRDRRWSKWKDYYEEDDRGLSKEERRERFAKKVAKEDEEARQRKLQEEMWNLHLERCGLLGHDPYFTPIFDPSGQYYWDPSAGTWQAYIGPSGNLPVPASYGMNRPEGNENICPNIPTNQMFVSGAFYPLPHTPVSDEEGFTLTKEENPLSLDLASIPLPGETPLSKGISPSESPGIPIPSTGAADDNMDIDDGSDTPDRAPPGPVTIKLPQKWKIARDNERNIYFYHTKTRHTQWDLPTNDIHSQLMIRYGLTSDSESDLESDSDSSTSSDSEDFSSDEDENEEEEVEADPVKKIENEFDEKMIRRPKGKKIRSERLVQERVISPILFRDREAARRERKEAKERARVEARKERMTLLKTLKGGTSSGGSSSSKKLDVDSEKNPSLTEDAMSPNENEDDEHLEEQLQKFARRQKSDGKHKAKSKERAATALADTSDIARKIKDSFRSRMATYIVSVLNPYRKGECKEGRITSNEDFKYLARKLTHFVMVKELKQLPSIDGLECSESVKHKTKEFVRKYMSKYGDTFKRDPNDTKEY